MTNIDYKKLYEDAYKRAKRLDSPFYRDAAEIIFPELKATFMEDKICEAIEYAISSATHEDGTIINGITREQALEYFRNKKEQPQETIDTPCEESDIIGKAIEDIRASLEQKLKEQDTIPEDHDLEVGEEKEDIGDIVDKLIESVRGSAMLEYQLKKHSINPEELVCRLEELKKSPWSVSDKEINNEKESEWNEDDSNIVNGIQLVLELWDRRHTVPNGIPSVIPEYISWLYNVRHKHCWKPTEEQLRAVFDASERNDKLGSVLRNLYNELRKL